MRPTKTALEVAYRLAGRAGLAKLLRGAGWLSCACPLCPPRDRASITAYRRWKAMSVAWGKDEPSPCELCNGTRRLRLNGTFTRENETVYPCTR